MLVKNGEILVMPQLKEFDRGRRLISAYYTAFNNEDAHRDIGVKGMTLKSVAQNGPKSARPRIKHFLNHDITQPISAINDMGETDFGAYYTGLVGTHNGGEDFLKMADSGLITEHSYRLIPLQRDKNDKRKMLEVAIKEVSSLTHWGANENTPFISGVTGKSMEPMEIAKHYADRVVALRKFCRNTDATDDLIESLLLEIEAISSVQVELLSKMMSTMTATPEVPEQTGKQEDAADYSGLMKSLSELNNIFKNV